MLYPAAGGSDDWAYGGAGIPYSYTIGTLTLYRVHCTPYSVHCTPYSVDWTPYCVHCTPYGVNCVNCTLYTLKCTLYNLHLIYLIIPWGGWVKSWLVAYYCQSKLGPLKTTFINYISIMAIWQCQPIKKQNVCLGRIFKKKSAWIIKNKNQILKLSGLWILLLSDHFHVSIRTLDQSVTPFRNLSYLWHTLNMYLTYQV